MTDMLAAGTPRPLTAIRARRYDALASTAFALADASLFVLAALLAEAIDFRITDPTALVRSFFLAPIVFVVLWMVLFSRCGLYRVSFAMSARDEFYIVAAVLVVGIVPQFVLFTLVPALSGSRLELVLSALFAMLFIGGARAGAHLWTRERNARRRRRIAFAGDAPNAWLRRRVNPSGEDVIDLPSLALDTPADAVRLIEACSERAATALYLTSMPATATIGALLAAAQTHGIAVRIALDPLLTGACRYDVDDDGRGALLAPRPLRACTIPGKTLKRIVDLAVAAPILVLTAPIMALAATAILVETGRPIFFRHERIGRDGIPFEMLKFRSMAVRHDHGNGWAQRNDPRITRVGALLRRLSIDELPQLINVLRGDMSIVGPRPEMPSYVERFRATIPGYDDRHLIKPGITGWSQVYMQRLLTPEDAADVLRHDLFYIHSWGLIMDITIIAKTAAEFLFHSPA